MTGINRKNRSSLKYPDLQSAHRQVAHCDEIPVPVFGELPDISEEGSSGIEENEEEAILDDDDPLFPPKFKENNSLSNSACITFYRNRYEEYGTAIFFYEEKDLVYYTDIAQLLHNLKIGDCSLTAASDR